MFRVEKLAARAFKGAISHAKKFIGRTLKDANPGERKDKNAPKPFNRLRAGSEHLEPETGLS